MRNYIVITDNGAFVSKSRDSRKHLRYEGGDACEVYQASDGKMVSYAKRDANDNIFNAYFEKGKETLKDNHPYLFS